MLIVLSGLPGSGKTSLARALVTAARAVHVRLDTVEQALVDAGTATHPVGPVGHHVARAVAGDLLRQGHLVVADGVNPLPVTRELWWDVARAADRPWLDVEVVCGDPPCTAVGCRTGWRTSPATPNPRGRTWNASSSRPGRRSGCASTSAN